MAYSQGGLIEASDYNNFVGNTTAGLNRVWSTGAGDAGYGQTNIGTVSVAAEVTATNWATLVNTIAAAASHNGTTPTPRTAPAAGNLIEILNNVSTDITNITTNRGNAVASGTVIGTFSGDVSKTSATGSGADPWTITFTQTVTFGSADATRYFFNAGGIVKLLYNKSSTGTVNDTQWNTLSQQTGSINFTGRVNATTNTIAGEAYTGTTRLGGTGGTQTTLATTTGFYNLTAGGSAVTVFQLNNETSPYNPDFIRTTVALNAGGTVLTFVTTWVDDGGSGEPGSEANISGGTATSSPATSISGTAPTTLLNVIPPSTEHLTASWGTPTIASSVA
jgi:hypothetical protein